ncbi:MAG: helix-turn-helix transcriptional regulator [Clostridiales bacterium]|jgi:DNA-binding Xre family transcriptional regulator|nr:helix-turn-helix transcriptional regulator [Clostridiales bacterium]
MKLTSCPCYEKQDLLTVLMISTAIISKLNHSKNLNTDILVKICNALQCNVADIMDIALTPISQNKE